MDFLQYFQTLIAASLPSRPTPQKVGTGTARNISLQINVVTIKLGCEKKLVTLLGAKAYTVPHL